MLQANFALYQALFVVNLLAESLNFDGLNADDYSGLEIVRKLEIDWITYDFNIN